MNIGQAAKRTGLSVKTIHYYESIGLVIANRKNNGYRDYEEALVHKLAFVQRARGLGFAIDECRALLSLSQQRRARHRATQAQGHRAKIAGPALLARYAVAPG